MWGPGRVHDRDAIIGIASSGLHSNGYSLVRRLILEHDLDLHETRPQLNDRSLGEELLRPTTIYAPAMIALSKEDGIDVHAAAHITGGGIVGNVPRALPEGVEAALDPLAWPRPSIFAF